MNNFVYSVIRCILLVGTIILWFVTFSLVFAQSSITETFEPPSNSEDDVNGTDYWRFPVWREGGISYIPLVWMLDEDRGWLQLSADASHYPFSYIMFDVLEDVTQRSGSQLGLETIVDATSLNGGRFGLLVLDSNGKYYQLDFQQQDDVLNVMMANCRTAIPDCQLTQVSITEPIHVAIQIYPFQQHDGSQELDATINGTTYNFNLANITPLNFPDAISSPLLQTGDIGFYVENITSQSFIVIEEMIITGSDIAIVSVEERENDLESEPNNIERFYLRGLFLIRLDLLSHIFSQEDGVSRACPLVRGITKEIYESAELLASLNQGIDLDDWLGISDRLLIRNQSNCPQASSYNPIELCNNIYEFVGQTMLRNNIFSNNTCSDE